MGSSPTVGLSYANGSANTVRPTGMDYPSGRSLNFDYGTSGGISDHASRIATLIDDNGTTHLADDSFLGLGANVAADVSAGRSFSSSRQSTLVSRLPDLSTPVAGPVCSR